MLNGKFWCRRYGWILLALFVGMAIFVISPLFEQNAFNKAVKELACRAAIAFVVFPWLLTAGSHNSDFLSNARRNLLNTLFAFGGLAAIGSLILSGMELYHAAFVAALISWVFLFWGCRFLYLKAQSREEILSGQADRERFFNDKLFYARLRKSYVSTVFFPTFLILLIGIPLLVFTPEVPFQALWKQVVFGITLFCVGSATAAFTIHGVSTGHLPGDFLVTRKYDPSQFWLTILILLVFSFAMISSGLFIITASVLR